MRARGVARTTCVAAVVGLALSFASRAQATDDKEKALAEALFEDGRALMESGRTEEACAKFAMSLRIEPKLGTLLNLAVCHETTGKTATAWAEFTEARTRAAQSNQPDRVDFAREHADALAPRLSRISISAPSGLPYVVTIDDVALNSAGLDTAFPVDPGEHVLVVRAAGRRPFTQQLTVPQGPSLTRVEVPDLEIEPPPPPPPPAERVVVPPPPPNQLPMWIAFGTGVAAAAVGTTFGISAFAKRDEGRAECNGDACSQKGLDHYDQATTFAHVSTAAFAVALVATGVGVYFLLRSPSAPPPKSAVSSNGFVVRW
jgi:hypothetical protein